MNEHEKDWLDLGQKLQHYQPVGQPETDYQDLLRRRRNRSLLGYLLGLAGLSVLAWLLWLTPPGGGGGLRVVTTGFSQGTANVGPGASLRPARTGPAAGAAPAIVSQEKPSSVLAGGKKERAPGSPSSSPGTTEARRSSPSSSTFRTADPSLALLTSSRSTTTRLPGPLPGRNLVSGAVLSGTVVGVADSNAYRRTGIKGALPAGTARERFNDPSPALPAEPLTLLPAPVALSAPVPTLAFTPRTTFTAGIGLGGHWRGEAFLDDIDPGLYAYVGLERRIGQRLSAEITAGYRGHGLDARTSGETDHWTYTKKEQQRIGADGRLHSYAYEGYVTGYRALEFMLLLNYRLTDRFGLHAGGRYALPTFEFKEVLHGPVEGQPYTVSANPGSLVRNHDYGLLVGGDYYLNDHLAVRATLSFGLIDLIDDAAEERVRRNHSSSLNLGFRYLIR